MKIQRLEEGDYICKFFDSRFDRNKNILAVFTGSTGSGKSYSCLRTCQLWYKHKFNESFPIENCCFSVGEVMRRLTKGNLRRGELLILEEAGANLGSLDFQNKVSKLFTYVLQSFRSMNVGLLFNLPVLTMLNKQCRQLVHIHLITQSINPQSKICTLKIYMHQLNQSSGKSYWKFPRMNVDGKSISLSALNFSLPESNLIKSYEAKKLKFVTDLTIDFSAELDKIENDKIKKLMRDYLTDKQRRVYELAVQGHNQPQIAEIVGVSQSAINQIIQAIRSKGYKLQNGAISLGNKENQLISANPEHLKLILLDKSKKITTQEKVQEPIIS